MSAYVKVGGEFAVNADAANDEYGALIATFADGSYLLTWVEDMASGPGPTQHRVVAQLYDASGAKTGAAFQVNQGEPALLQSLGVTAFAGGFVVTWQNGEDEPGERGVKARLFDTAGNALGDEFMVAAGFQNYPKAITLDNGGFVVTWDSSNTLRAQIFDASGAKVGGEIVTSTDGNAWYATSDVVALEGGGFVVSWRWSATGNYADYDVYARIFDDAGNALGAKFQLNNATSATLDQPQLTALAGGGFVALWVNNASGSPGGKDIRGQRFDAAGNEVGGEFVVNQLTAGDQTSAQATSLADGGFLVAWQTSDTTQDGSFYAIKARQFGADGQPVGNEFLLNTQGADYQWIADLATMADGRVLATWRTAGEWNSYSDLRAQFLYTAPNAAPQITSAGGGVSASFTVAENETTVSTVAAADADGPLPISYWIGGGADAALFAIDKTTGALRFVAAPDFESPTDADANGVYQVTVEARDGLSVDTQAISVAVTDVAGDGLSFFRTALSAFENGLAGPTLLASGGDGAPLAYAIVGGADAALFTLDAQTGALGFTAGQDFEAPGDADGDGVYQVEVTADDGTYDLTRTISVTLANVNEGLSWISGPAFTMVENEYIAGTLVASDADGDPVTYVITGGADADLFTVDSESGTFGFWEPADFELPLDADGDNVYEVEIAAYDGEFAEYQLVTVTVTDFEPEQPLAFVETAFGIDENIEGGGFQLVATNGTSQPLTYEITGGADAGMFSLDPDSGWLVFGYANDFEAPADADSDNFYEVEVTAFGDTEFTTATITVAVLDVDEAPVIYTNGGEDTAAVSVYGGASVAVTSVYGYDPEGVELTFSIVGGADAALFTLSAYAELSFANPVDHAAPADADGDNVYEVVVQASDGGLVDTQAISVTVLAPNLAPVFSGSSTFSVAENTTTVGSISASDPEGQPISYSIGYGADSFRFSINSTTGALRFLTAPNFEVRSDIGANNIYDVVVVASDGAVTSSRALAITVTNVNEAPVITSNGGGATATVSVAENGSAVTTVTSTDPESTPRTYSIVGGADAARFVINPSSGQLVFTSPRNFESPGDANGNNVYEVTVRASDGALSDTQAISVTVTNVNEAPVITSNGGGASATLAVQENATAVTTVLAVDPESGVTYSLTGGVDEALFSINSSTGALRFIAAPNFEAPGDSNGDNLYHVTVRASDGTLSDTQSLQITVANVNEAPVIVSNGGGAAAGVAVSENGTAVATVVANDLDSSVAYAISGGADAALFAIDAATGALRFVTAPDFEAPGDAGGDNVYDVIVSASDGSLSDSQALSVAVGGIDEAPAIVSGGGGATAAVTVGENATAITTVVAADPEGAVTYALAGGADAALFTIDAATGALSFLAAQNFESPGDADGDNVFELVVSASDGTLSDSQALAVTIANIDEAPVIRTTTGSLVENSMFVVWVWAQDSEHDLLSYSIAGGADGALFTMFGSDLRFRFLPDFEAPSDADGDNVYDVVVGVSDGTTMTTGTITVTLNNQNETPTIAGGTNASFTVGENATAVTTIVATDPEGGITYSIGTTGDAAFFTIDAGTGVLRFAAAPDFEAPGDADGNNTYRFTVWATDGELSDFQQLTVTVAGVNEAPQITSNGGGATAAVAVSENGTAVATVAAADPESGVTYAIAGGADAALFAIDAATGALGFASAPDFETPGDANADNAYEVVVSASDGSLADAQALLVTVGNVDEAPEIGSNGGGASAALAVEENATAVTTVAASDPEGGVTYALDGGADAARFAIDAASGALSFLAAPDFDAPADADGDNVYQVVVSASDGTVSDTQALSVAVTDVNESPSFVGATEWSLDENEDYIGLLAALDPEGQSLTYFVAGGADADLFRVIAATGEFGLVPAPDFESPTDADGDNVYELVVGVTDNDTFVLTAIHVTLADVDETPAITSPAAFAALENDTAAGTVAATDPEGTALKYHIVGGADAARLAIDLWTGALAFTQAPNFEAPADAGGDNVYDVLVEVDDGIHALTQAVSVTVGNVNETPVIASGGGGAAASYGVTENTTAIAVIAATDPESGVTYALAGGADAARFAINAATGALSFVAAPDYDAPADANGDNLYQVVVSATDGSLSDSQALTVSVANVVGVTLNGTSSANTLTGGSEEDTIRGLGGSDTLSGLGGNDLLDGGDGQDRLTGGAGADLLTGGLKADDFVYTALGDSTLAASDRILDFSHSQGDDIDLAALDANANVAGNQAFSFIGSAAFSGSAGQLRYFQQGGDTLVQGDVTGDGVADFQIIIDPLVTLSSSDFIL